MGGGKKRKSLTQMARAQERRSKSRSKGKASAATGASSGTDKKALRIVAPNPMDNRIRKELQSMKVLTPYTVASRFNLRLSVAKNFLKELHARGIITYVSGGRNIKIYKPTEQS